MCITPAGRTLLGQIASAPEPRAATMQREFDERELRRTLNTLRKLRERLIAEYRRPQGAQWVMATQDRAYGGGGYSASPFTR